MSDQAFRWRAFFQRSTEPLFLLNRQCYLLFVNRAWERLTGLGAAQSKRMSCRSTAPPKTNAEWEKVIAHILTPPAEVRHGVAGRERRLVPGRDGSPARWWDIDFLPFCDQNGFRGLLGRIVPVATPASKPASPLPEAVVNLRQRRREQLNELFLSRRLPALRRVAEQADLAAGVRAPVLLVGGPGTGKQTLARAIHLRGPDRERSFAALDCRRLPAFAVGSLLLGDRGSLARATLATVYLKEPSCLPRELQVRLCEWLTGLGTGTGPQSEAEPRLLAGCSLDPEEEVRQGRLLPDLYHALGTLRIDLPPLRERRDDLPHLVDRLLRRLNAAGEKQIQSLSADAWEVVLAYGWPGNLRELYAVLHSAREHASAEVIDAADLPAPVRRAVLPDQTAAPPAPVIPLKSLLERVERRLIELALKRTHGNQTQAADLLAVWRPYLLRRIAQLRIKVTDKPVKQAKRGIKKRTGHRLSPPPTENSES
jgi:PAS domain S-box-containing protein